MALRQRSRIAGAVQDVARLQELPGDDCNVLFVSSRTLYLLANLAQKEVGWLGRYVVEFLDGGWVETVEEDTVEAEFVGTVANNFGLEVIPMTCDLVGAINAQTAMLASLVSAVRDLVGAGAGGCGGGCGTVIDPEELNDGFPPIGEGERWPTQGAYNDAKCNVAHAIVDTLTAQIDVLDDYNVDDLFAGGVALATAMIATLLAAGPVGWAAAAVVGVVAGIVNLIVGAGALNLGDLEESLTNDRNLLICMLYNAPSSDIVKDSIMEYFGTTPATLLELGLINLLLPTYLLNQLFDPTEEAATYQSENPFDCSACAPLDGAWEIVVGTGVILYGEDFIITSADIGGGVQYMHLRRVIEFGGDEENMCVVFRARSAMNDTSANYTRTLYYSANGVQNYGNEDFDFNSDPADCFPDLDDSYPISMFEFASDSTPFTVTLNFQGQVAAVDALPSASTACD